MKKIKKQITLAALAVVLTIASLVGFGNQSNLTMMQNKRALAYVQPVVCYTGGDICYVIVIDENGIPIEFIRIPGYKNYS